MVFLGNFATIPCDIERLEEIKDMIQKKRINIQGVKKILSTTTCWEIKSCKAEEKKVCLVYIRYRPVITC